MGGSSDRIITLPPTYHFEIGQKVRARNSVSNSIHFGKVVAFLPISHGYIIETNFDKKLLYFEGKELEIDEG